MFVKSDTRPQPDASADVGTGGGDLSSLTPRRAILVLSLICHLAACSGGGKFNTEKGPQTDNEPAAQGPAAAQQLPPQSGEAPSLLLTRLESVTQATESEVVGYFRARCVACHGPGGPNASFWTIDFDGLNKAVLTSDPQASTVFQTLVNAIEGRPKPPAMPLGANFKLDKEAETQHLKVLKWYLADAADVAATAWLDYKQFNPYGAGTDVRFDYTCKTPVSLRAFLSRFTMDAFDRLPSQVELSAFSSEALEAPVTAAQRKDISSRVRSHAAWRNEFLDKGFRRFAMKLSGAEAIRSSGAADEKPAGTPGKPDVLKAGLTADEARDLKDEFYQTLLANIDTTTGQEKKRYQDILLGNELAVSDTTRNLYGCPGRPQPGQWLNCDIAAVSTNKLRKSYFTSFSYLASLPSSVFIDNNNYARTSALYFFIRGIPLKAATNGPTGGAIKALPSCLKSKDTRGHQAGSSFSPIGTIQIPMTGNVCQSCHIDRNLANGSLLFRPFGAWGQYISSTDIGTQGALIPGIDEALKMDRRSITDPQDPSKVTTVDIQFLQGLMPDASGMFDGEEACLVVDDTQIKLNNVKDLAEFLIGDGRPLAAGMARHIPRGISNLSTTNSELIQLMERTFSEGDSKLLPLFQAYFASETYSCRNQE